MKKTTFRKIVFIITGLLAISGISLLYLTRLKHTSPALNIVLISIDAARPDHFSCYGYGEKTTPVIDKLAQKGTLFKQAIAQGSYTHSSLPSLISSLYPSTTGIYTWYRELLPSEQDILPQLLRNKGYATAFICPHPIFEDFPDMFDLMVDPEPPTADNVVQEALRFVKNNRRRPLFVWMHFMDAHDIPAPAPEEHPEVSKPEEEKKYVAMYDKAIGYVDSQIDLFLKNLRRLRKNEPVLVIITADHGEGINDHGLFFDHGRYLWDCLIKVPLIFYSPGLIPENKTVNCQAQLVDIAPTLCSILSIDKPGTFEGKNLFPDEENGAACSTYAFSEFQETREGEWIYTKVSIREFPWHLIYTLDKEGVTYELFNLEKDPGEYNDVKEAEKDRFLTLKKVLLEWMAREKPAVPSRERILDEETKDKLRSLGYMQ